MCSGYGDFTVTHYRELLKLAKLNYCFSSYEAIPWGERFVLWRHDLDLSINRAVAMAEIEAEEGVAATYFLNPRSEFYNPFDISQSALVRRIISLGHQIGLHFDAAYHQIDSEKILAEKIEREAKWLESEFLVPVKAFSFHNPLSQHLQFEAENYAGIVNTYSRRFKSEVGYCSDSNGYWRFRRLYDVLSRGEDSCLQVLTHPGWWQEKPMPPRQRVYRSAFGRALYTMKANDSALEDFGRENSAGLIKYLDFLKVEDQKAFELYDFLWNQGYSNALCFQLLSFLERKIEDICFNFLVNRLGCPESEVNDIISINRIDGDGLQLFFDVFEEGTEIITKIKKAPYYTCLEASKRFLMGKDFGLYDYDHLCWYLAKSIQTIASINYLDDDEFKEITGVDLKNQNYLENGSFWPRLQQKILLK